MNLTSARAATRMKEVVIRKVMGALRPQLIGQFLGEALLMSLAAFMIAILIVNLALPVFNQIAGNAAGPGILADPTIAVGLLVAMVLIGLIAGAYPVSGFNVAMSQSLNNFAYHIPLSWLIFVSSGLLGLLIAVLTVMSQSLRAAKADPADSIRYE